MEPPGGGQLRGMNEPDVISHGRLLDAAAWFRAYRRARLDRSGRGDFAVAIAFEHLDEHARRPLWSDQLTGLVTLDKAIVETSSDHCRILRSDIGLHCS